MDKAIWTLTEEEKNKLIIVFEKKAALEKLCQIIDKSNEDRYNNLLSDYSDAEKEFQNWWIETSEKYKWEGKSWYINFETNEVMMRETVKVDD